MVDRNRPNTNWENIKEFFSGDSKSSNKTHDAHNGNDHHRVWWFQRTGLTGQRRIQ